MIRPFTFICMVSAFASGMYLYTEKHRAELVDRQIARAIHETEAARQRTGLLRADWALLNDPARLQDMADKYLALKPMAPSQFVQLADLPNHVPAPVAPTALGTTDDDAQSPDQAASAPPADTGPAAAAPAEQDSQPVIPIASAQLKTPAKPDPGRPGTRLVAHAPKKVPHPTVVADRESLPHDRPLTPSGPLPLASPQPTAPRVMSALARPQQRVMARPAIVAAVPRSLPASSYVGSALGNHASLPPPVPYGGQQ